MLYKLDKVHQIRVKPPYRVLALMVSDGALCSMSCKSHQKGINLFKLITISKPPTRFLIHISHPHKPLFFQLERHAQGEILQPQNVTRCCFLASCCLETLLFPCCCIFILLPSCLCLLLSPLFCFKCFILCQGDGFSLFSHCSVVTALAVYFCSFSLYSSCVVLSVSVSFHGADCVKIRLL